MTPTVHLKTKTKTNTKTKTKTECLKGPAYAIFLESRGLKDIKFYILTSQLVNFSLVNQTSPDQTRPDQTNEDQGRPQSRGPNDRTGVLVNVVQCQTLYCCIMQLIDHNHPTHSIQFKHTVSLRAQSIPEKVKNSRPINMGFKGWGRLL